MPILTRYGGAFFYQVSRQAVDASLWKLFATCFACMLVAVARVVQLGSTLEVTENQRYEKVSEVNGGEDGSPAW